MNDRAEVERTEEKSPDTTIFSLLHAAQVLEDRVESALDKVGLSIPKYSVLSELVSSGKALSLSELALRLSCVRSNMTQLVDRLEADGVVKRVNCPSDRRAVKAEITDLGRERQAAGSAEVAALHVVFASKVRASDSDAIGRLMESLG